MRAREDRQQTLSITEIRLYRLASRKSEKETKGKKRLKHSPWGVGVNQEKTGFFMESCKDFLLLVIFYHHFVVLKCQSLWTCTGCNPLAGFGSGGAVSVPLHSGMVFRLFLSTPQAHLNRLPSLWGPAAPHPPVDGRHATMAKKKHWCCLWFRFFDVTPGFTEKNCTRAPFNHSWLKSVVCKGYVPSLTSPKLRIWNE